MNRIIQSNHGPVQLWQLGSNLFGQPKMHVYSFLVDGLLIDTGQPRVGRDFCQALEKTSIEKIVLTHHHEDHSGNVESIKKMKNIDAYASDPCCRLMLKPKLVEPARFITWGQHTRAVLTPLSNEQTLYTDQYTFHIMNTPGHSIDQISLYEPEEGWLFPGDLYVNDYIKVFMREEEFGQQITSIKTLLKLDFDVLFCNHNPLFKRGRQHLKNKLQFLEDFYGSVHREYMNGTSPKRIMKALRLRENRIVKLLSMGQLSTLNMVRSVIRHIENSTE